MPGRAHTTVTFAMLVTATGACTETTPTQLVVYIDTDMTVPSEMDGFRIRVLDEAGELARAEDFRVGPEDDAVELPASFGVAPRGGDAARRVRVEAAGLRGDTGTVVVTTAAATSFVEEAALRLDMFLARRCKDVACAANEACRPDGCLPVEVDPESLPDDGSDAPSPVGCVPRGLLASRRVLRRVGGLARMGTDLLVADFGFGRIDLTNPEDPGEYVEVNIGGNAWDVVARGDTALVSNVEGLHLIFGDGEWVAPDNTFRRDIAGAAFVRDDLVVAAHADGIWLFDPAAPDEIVAEATGFFNRAIAVEGSLAFSTWGYVLDVIDLTVPTSPVLRGSAALDGGCSQIDAAGTDAFVACAEDGLRIVSAVDPGAPAVVSTTDWPAVDLQVRGAYLFVAAGAEGLVILDVTEPAAPAFVTSFAVSGTGLAGAVFVDGGLAYVGTSEVEFTEPCYVDVFDVACFGAP